MASHGHSSQETLIQASETEVENRTVYGNQPDSGEAVRTEGVVVSRKRRWTGLSTVHDVNKKARRRNDEERLLGYSYANWEQVKHCFRVVAGSVGASHSPGLSTQLLSALQEYLSFASICSIWEGHQPKRVHLISPIIAAVSSHFNGGIEVLADEEVQGSRLHFNGLFDFVVKRRDKRICIVEAKKDDILQGRTQCMLGCESLCDAEGLAVTYGVSTNFYEWCFIEVGAEVVTEEMLTIGLENNKPTASSLKVIADKLIAILE